MTSLRRHLATFIDSLDHLTEVYALAILLGPDNDSVTFAAADEPTVEAKLSEMYPDVRPPWEDQFWGTRWNPGEFPHAQTVEVPASLNAAVEAIEKAEFSFQTTNEFVAFVARFDQSEAERKRWMQRTIAPGSFEELFPELVAFDQFLDDASAMPPAEQATYWAAAMEELTLKSATPRAARLMELGRTQYDALDALIGIGEPAINPLMGIIERHALRPPFNPPNSLAFQIHGALSAESKLTTDAMFALAEIGDVDDDIVERLRALLRELIGDYPGEGTVGVAAAVAARILHSLRPGAFPEADVNPDDNRLLNQDAY